MTNKYVIREREEGRMGDGEGERDRDRFCAVSSEFLSYVFFVVTSNG